MLEVGGGGDPADRCWEGYKVYMYVQREERKTRGSGADWTLKFLDPGIQGTSPGDSVCVWKVSKPSQALLRLESPKEMCYKYLLLIRDVILQNPAVNRVRNYTYA
jgi:hypothetical protein